MPITLWWSRIYLLEGESAPTSDVATATTRLGPVWQQGLSGAGIRLAIVEGEANGTHINGTARGCLNVVATLNPSLPDRDHISQVAAVAGCRDDTRPGVAEDVAILDGGFNTNNVTFSTVFSNTLGWAIRNQQADIVNVSWSVWNSNDPTSTILRLEDRMADYWVRYYSKTIVVAAGNATFPYGATVPAPGKGWNVLTVGNMDDRNTIYCGDDTINNNSSFVDPATGMEKPEVAAPGTAINTIAGEATGTSYAAPHVSGLAALMMQRHGELRQRPTTVKAIILASAVHNVEGDQILSDRDGAGAIDAAAAVEIAGNKATGDVCTKPCWWALPDPPPGPSLLRYIRVIRGERVRIVTSWLSTVTGSSANPNDALTNNYDLFVRNGRDRSIVASSAHDSNNFEIVEFVAPETGEYIVDLYRRTADSTSSPALAWTRLATYAPDVRTVSGGWNSTLYVRNDDALARSFTANFFNDNGALTDNRNANVEPRRVWTISRPPAGVGAAVVCSDPQNLDRWVSEVR